QTARLFSSGGSPSESSYQAWPRRPASSRPSPAWRVLLPGPLIRHIRRVRWPGPCRRREGDTVSIAVFALVVVIWVVLLVPLARRGRAELAAEASEGGAGARA